MDYISYLRNMVGHEKSNYGGRRLFCVEQKE